MSSTTYAVAESGSFNAGSVLNFGVSYAELSVTEKIDDVTGNRVGGTADKNKQFIHGLPTGDVLAVGYMYDISTSSYPVSQSGTFGTPAWDVGVQQWQLRKSWSLTDVTVAGDATKQWQAGLPTVTISVSGIAKTSDPGNDFDLASDDPEQDVVFDLDKMGAISCTAMLTRKEVKPAFHKGGPIPYSYSAVLQDVTSYSSDDDNYDWLFPSGTTAFDGSPVRGTLVLDIDASTNISESALCYDVTLACRPQHGGIQPMVCKFRWD